MSTKNRGACRRTSKFFFVVTVVSPCPTFVPSPMAQVLIFQPVRLSGILKLTSASPPSSVVTPPAQNAVSAKLERIVGEPTSPAPSAAPPPASALASASASPFWLSRFALSKAAACGTAIPGADIAMARFEPRPRISPPPPPNPIPGPAGNPSPNNIPPKAPRLDIPTSPLFPKFVKMRSSVQSR